MATGLVCVHVQRLNSYLQIYLFIIGFTAHTKLQMKSTRVANKVNSVAKGL